MKLVEKKGRKKSCSFLVLLFVKAKYSLDSNLWLTASFTHSPATTELLYRIYYKPLAPWAAERAWKFQQCLSGTSHPSFTRSCRLSGILGGLFGQQPLALSQHRDYTELGASLWLFNRLMAIRHRQGTVFATSSVLHDFISVLSPKNKRTSWIFLDDEYYIWLKQFFFFKDQKTFLPALLRYWTFIQARTFIGACSDFSSAEHLPSKALLLNQNIQKLQGIFPVRLHCPNPLTPFRDSPLTTVTLSIWSTGDHNSAGVFYENRYI